MCVCVCMCMQIMKVIIRTSSDYPANHASKSTECTKTKFPNQFHPGPQPNLT